jgi:hypothetical protein
MADERRFAFAAWVPKAACRELQQLANSSDADHRLLERLASYEEMRDVWEKLPAAAYGRENLIIRRTYAIARLTVAWSGLEHFRKYSSLRTAEKVSRAASQLLDAMRSSGEASASWHLWPGDVQITFEDALSFVEHLVTFYRRADAQYKGIVEGYAGLSKVLRKKNAKAAQEIFFSRWLTDCFQNDFKSPLDPIVATLSSVVFDREGEGAMAPTIRGRRRWAPRRGRFEGA